MASISSVSFNYGLILYHRCKELEAEVAKRDADLTQMAELFKKETALRKKYKNELEDLKGYVCKYWMYEFFFTDL